ncbi:MAG: DUF1080 domain-containing protein [Acidobacteria bacterium]|nr:DUF1080 domain-containing protein [Acidobacteriota bacterium]
MADWTPARTYLSRAAVAGALTLMAGGFAATSAQTPPPHAPLIGRWDLTVDAGPRKAPSWLEVELSGTRTLVGQFVGTGGSARPVSKVDFADGAFSFTIPPQWGTADTRLEGRLDGDRLVGTITEGDRTQAFTGVRAPALKRPAPAAWGPPITLFDGKSLDGWQALGRGDSQWSAADGVLKNAARGANLRTTQTFEDFKLHLEFRVPKGENSGVYLRGRYELQIDDPTGLHSPSHHTGGVYGFLAPSEDAGKGPDVWQTMDVTLVGRTLTYVLNGKTVICEREIPGITGGALDSDEGAPGPIYFQGDHGPVEFRNIVITPAKR